MALLDKVLGWVSFFCVCAAVLVSPWLFGAWEAWWFWLFAVFIFASAVFLSARVMIGGRPVHLVWLGPRGLASYGLAGYLLFLLYAFVRMGQADVFMDAERSFLLFLTPFLLAAAVVLGFGRGQLKWLYVLIVGNLCCLGLYGIFNHMLANSTRVLWVVTEYTQYAGRATGTYFCPDHFSGAMELLLAMGLGLLIWRDPRVLPLSDIGGEMPVRFLAIAAIPISISGVLLSQSRGGVLTVLGVLSLAFLWWTAGMDMRMRWATRIGGAAVAIIASAVIWSSDAALVTRFREYFPWDPGGDRSLREAAREVAPSLMASPRYNMYSAAMRAWRETDPLFGIGPGMHQHLWPHYAASPDGDRERGIWPSRPNADYHSFEVHSDWIQLLEEYGMVGLIIFLAAAGGITVVLLAGLRRGMAEPAVAGALLCIAAMAAHSFVDFNLQMPATTWMLSAIVAVPLAWIYRSDA